MNEPYYVNPYSSYPYYAPQKIANNLSTRPGSTRSQSMNQRRIGTIPEASVSSASRGFMLTPTTPTQVTPSVIPIASAGAPTTPVTPAPAPPSPTPALALAPTTAALETVTTPEGVAEPGGFWDKYWWLPLLAILVGLGWLWWRNRRVTPPTTESAVNVPPIAPPQPGAFPSGALPGVLPPSVLSTAPAASPPATTAPPAVALPQLPGIPSISNPVLPVIALQGQGQPSATARTPFGTLTGDVTTDTSNIFTVDDIVALYSVNAKKYLRFVSIEQGLPNEDSAPEADLVLEATGTDVFKDLSCQWRVRPPHSYKRSVRLENVGNQGEYLREFVRQNPVQDLPVAGWQAGVGLEWSDLWSTTRNFLDASFTDTVSVIIIGAKVADLVKIRTLDKNTAYTLAARLDGTIIRPDKALASDVSSLWEVRVIGKHQPDGTVAYIKT